MHVQRVIRVGFFLLHLPPSRGAYFVPFWTPQTDRNNTVLICHRLFCTVDGRKWQCASVHLELVPISESPIVWLSKIKINENRCSHRRRRFGLKLAQPSAKTYRPTSWKMILAAFLRWETEENNCEIWANERPFCRFEMWEGAIKHRRNNKRASGKCKLRFRKK